MRAGRGIRGWNQATLADEDGNPLVLRQRHVVGVHTCPGQQFGQSLAVGLLPLNRQWKGDIFRDRQMVEEAARRRTQLAARPLDGDLGVGVHRFARLADGVVVVAQDGGASRGIARGSDRMSGTADVCTRHPVVATSRQTDFRRGR